MSTTTTDAPPAHPAERQLRRAIRGYMSALDITVRDMQRALGMASSTWHSKMNPGGALSVTDIARIAEVLGVEIGALFEDTIVLPPIPPTEGAVHRQGLEPRTRWLRAVVDGGVAPGTSSMPLSEGDERLWPDVATMPQLPQIPRMYGKSIDSPPRPKRLDKPVRTPSDRVVA